MPRRDSTSTLLLDHVEAFDRERGRVLRKRIQWYCILAIALMLVGLTAYLPDLLGLHAAGTPTNADTVPSLVGAAENLSILLLYSGVLAYLLIRRPPRSRLVWVLTWLTITALAIAMSFEVLKYQANRDAYATAEDVRSAQAWAGAIAIMAFAMMFTLACVLVPMTIRESARIALACFTIFVAVTVLLVKAPANLSLWLMLGFISSAAPGMAWSWWRYREFDARFQAACIKERFENLTGEVQELSAELVQARRLHEALFPPQIAVGPIRLAYRYEPMREIGGDFLFVHTAPSGTLSVVLIDVSGHGIPAALAVNRIHGELQRLVAVQPEVTPDALLKDINTYALAALGAQGVFATAMCVRVDDKARTLTWANAGHPTAFVRTTDGEMHELASTATMLGILDPSEYDPSPQSMGFAACERLLSYTDGAMEARDAWGKELSMPGIARLARAGWASGETSVADLIMRAVVAHRDGGPMDDTLIIEIEFAAVPSSVHTGVAGEMDQGKNV